MFQARVTKMTLEGDIDESDEQNSENQRQAFAALKKTGKKAPTERVQTIVGAAGKISNNGPIIKSNIGGPSFQIFQVNFERYLSILIFFLQLLQDENGQEIVPVKKKGSSIGPVSGSSKENTRGGSVWTKNKMKQTAVGIVPVEEVNQYCKPSFQGKIRSNFSSFINILS